MNLQLIKIKRQNAFDYSLLSDFMKKKNGKLIFTAGFGNAGKISDNTKKAKLNLMQKFERKFQIQSIIKAYNDTFHIHPKKSENNLTPDKNQTTYFDLLLPQINKIKDTKNLKYIRINKNLSVQSQFYKNKNNRNSSMLIKPNISLYGKNTFLFNKKYNDNNKSDNNLDNSIDYNSYFYNTINYFSKGNKNFKEKDKNRIKSRKLMKNISQDCIYLFGQNKIVYKNKKEKTRNNNMDILGQNSEIQKTPFIDYNKDFNPSKTKYKLRKDYEFYKDKNKAYENFSEFKQEYISKIRKMFEKHKDVKYHYEYLPSHYTVKTMVRKNKIYNKL